MKRILTLVAFVVAAGSAAPSFASRDGVDLMLQEKAAKAVVAQRNELQALRTWCAATPACQAGMAPGADRK
jgi:hypothetical protein